MSYSRFACLAHSTKVMAKLKIQLLPSLMTVLTPLAAKSVVLWYLHF